MKDVELPLVPAKLADIVRGAEPPPAGRRAAAPKDAKDSGRKLRGEGSATVAASPEAVWTMLLDPATLQAVIPGCHGVEKYPTRISAPTSRSGSARSRAATGRKSHCRTWTSRGP